MKIKHFFSTNKINNLQKQKRVVARVIKHVKMTCLSMCFPDENNEVMDNKQNEISNCIIVYMHGTCVDTVCAQAL